LSITAKRMVIWGVLYFLMILSLITPLGLLTIHVIMIPPLLLFVMLDVKRFALIYAGIVAILLVLLGSGGAVLALLSIFFLVPVAAMGVQYRKGASSGSAVTSGIIALIAALLLLLLISSALGANVTEEFTQLIKSDPYTMAMITDLLNSEQKIELFIEVMKSLIPMMIIAFAVYYTLITHWLGRKLLSRMWQPVPKLKPMKEWMLPKSMVWYYLIIVIMDMVMRMDTGSVISVIVLNSLPLLTYAFALQGIGFLFFVADAKGWNRALPIVGIVLLPFVAQLLAWLGVFDVAFPLRRRFKQE
jgi:uncharacterized protein YybS (DUF2232 family)